MKINKLNTFLLLALIYQPLIFSKMSDGECTKFFQEIKSPDSKAQIEFYKNMSSCSSVLDKNSKFLEVVVNSYRELFKVNRAHNHLEPFMDYYEKHKAEVDKMVQQIPNKLEKEDFEDRLKTSLREFKEGNGE